MGFNHKSLLLCVVAISAVASQSVYAAPAAANALPFPGASIFENALNRLNNAWAQVQSETSIRALLGKSHNALAFDKTISNGNIQTVKFQHFYDGLEVIGSLAMHQKSAIGTEVVNRLAQFDLDTRAALSEADAMAVAMSLTGDRQIAAKPVLKILPEAEGGAARLVYWVDVTGDALTGGREVVIDAHSGEVIGNVSKHIAIAPINAVSAARMGTQITQNVSQGAGGKPALSSCTLTDLSNGQTREISPQDCQGLQKQDFANDCQVVMDDSPALLNPDKCQPQVEASRVVGNDGAAMRAFANSQAVLTYYMTQHNRNSYDDRGSSPTNIVHAGIGFDNAFWSTDQNIMVYGDGDGKEFGDFTLALDVAGHEQTHGVVAYTAKLLGMGESGALNEAFADFFGKMIANDGDWAIGRKLFLNPATAQGVRNLANPGVISFCAAYSADGHCAQEKPFPSNIRDKMVKSGTCDGSNDNCWVHENATIQGHASYLVAQALGNQKAGQLYYAALTHVLTAKDNLTTAARSIKALCPKVLDAASCKAVTNAYAQVGL